MRELRLSLRDLLANRFHSPQFLNRHTVDQLLILADRLAPITHFDGLHRLAVATVEEDRTRGHSNAPIWVVRQGNETFDAMLPVRPRQFPQFCKAFRSSTWVA